MNVIKTITVNIDSPSVDAGKISITTEDSKGEMYFSRCLKKDYPEAFQEIANKVQELKDAFVKYNQLDPATRIKDA